MLDEPLFTAAVASQLICQTDGVDVTCPPHVCPGSHVMLTCTVNQAVGSNLWKLPTNSCYSSQDVITLTQTAGACNGQQPKQCGPFTAQNIASSSGPCLTSSLSVMATMPTSTIKCGIIDINGHETIINTSNINIIGECTSYLFIYYLYM